MAARGQRAARRQRRQLHGGGGVPIIIALFCAGAAVVDAASVDMSGTIARPFAGGGVNNGKAPLNALLYGVSGVAACGACNASNPPIYISVGFAHELLLLHPDAATLVRVAGTGRGGYSNQGGPATSTQLYTPQGLALWHNVSSGATQLWVANAGSSTVQHVREDGWLVPFAGTGSSGTGADGVVATSSALFAPHGVCVLYNATTRGVSVYIADTWSNRIRLVNEAGIISTIVGEDTVLRPRSVFAVSNVNTGAVRLWIADTQNNVIRHVAASGQMTVVAGGGTQEADGYVALDTRLQSPDSVVVQNEGGSLSMWIADTGSHRIRKVGADGTTSTIAGDGVGGFSEDGGSAVASHISSPGQLSVIVDASTGLATVWFVDRDSQRVRRVSADGVITTVAGGGVSDGGPALAAQLTTPEPLAVTTNATTDSFRVYIGDTLNNRVRVVDEQGVISTYAGTGRRYSMVNNVPAIEADVWDVKAIAAWRNVSSRKDVVWIAESSSSRVRQIGEDGIIREFAGTGVTGDAGDGGPALAAQVGEPRAVAVIYNTTSAGFVVYIAQTFPPCVRVVNEAGIIQHVTGVPEDGNLVGGSNPLSVMLNTPSGIAAWFNASNSKALLWIADSNRYRILYVDAEGVIRIAAGNGQNTNTGDGGLAPNAAVSAPAGIAVVANPSTNKFTLFITARSDHRVRMVDEAGIMLTLYRTAGGIASADASMSVASLSAPTGIAAWLPVGSIVARVLVADTGNHRVCMITTPLPSATPSITSSPSGTASVSPTRSASSSVSSTPTPSPTGSHTPTSSPSPSQAPQFWVQLFVRV